MDANAALIGIVCFVAVTVAAIEWVTGRDRPFHTPDDDELDDGWTPTVLSGIEQGDDDPIDAEDGLFRVIEPGGLLNVDHLRGMDAIEYLLRDLVGDVLASREERRRRPRVPTAILLYGPPGVGMTVLAHVVARRFRARLVQLFASRALAETDGGSQPQIAVAVNEARYHLPSVLFIDELELLLAPEVSDVRCQRAANDLINESLRRMYGTSHVVIGAFSTHDAARLPPMVTRVFNYVVRVDVPDLEVAMLTEILRNTDHEILRAVPAGRLVERADLRRAPHVDTAA